MICTVIALFRSRSRSGSRSGSRSRSRSHSRSGNEAEDGEEYDSEYDEDDDRPKKKKKKERYGGFIIGKYNKIFVDANIWNLIRQTFCRWGWGRRWSRWRRRMGRWCQWDWYCQWSGRNWSNGTRYWNSSARKFMGVSRSVWICQYKGLPLIMSRFTNNFVFIAHKRRMKSKNIFESDMQTSR